MGARGKMVEQTMPRSMAFLRENELIRTRSSVILLALIFGKQIGRVISACLRSFLGHLREKQIRTLDQFIALLLS